MKEFNAKLLSSINPLDTIRSSTVSTFSTIINSSVERFFTGRINNQKEEKRFEKQTTKYNTLKEKGKEPSFKVVPMKIVNLDDLEENVIEIINRLERKLTAKIELDRNYHEMSLSLLEHFESKAMAVVYKITKASAKEKAIKLMEEVGIPDARLRYNQYPFQFSGGMRQRIVIAIALAADPDVLICDEPTTALDVTIQSQILELINKLKVERNLSIIFITHDLGVVANVADRIAVMYAGKIVEYGTADDLFYSPAHPYTWALLSSMPDLDTDEVLEAIPGTPPNMIYPPVGDAFAARNKYAMKIDFEKQPELFKISATHYAATWLLHPNAPKVDMPKVISDRIARMKKERESLG
ncbi:MAG: ABC transporter ATP-binding protein [Anaeroplasmataceae bacterium]